MIGTAFDVALVGPVCGLDEDEVLAALEEAEGARIVAEVPSTAPRYRFAHRLVRDTLYDELSAGRRARLNQRAAEAIESVHAGRLGDHLSALAHHYSRAAAPAGETGVQSGRTTPSRPASGPWRSWPTTRRSPGTTGRSTCIDGAAGFDEAARLDVLVALGEAQQQASDPAHRDTLLEAARTAQQLGRTDVLVRAALANTRAVTFSVALEVDADRVATLEAALGAIGDADSPERAELLAKLGLELVWAADPARRLECSDEAVAVARRAADPALLARVLPPRFYTIWSPDHAPRASGHHHGTARVGRRPR